MSQHIHEIVKVRGQKNKYRCANPRCYKTFEREMLRGKLSVCAVCHQNTLTLGAYDLQLAFPRCLECSTRSSVKQKVEKRKVFESLLGDILHESNN